MNKTLFINVYMGICTSPLSIRVVISCGFFPSTVQPMDVHVPRTSLTQLFRVLASNLEECAILAILTISERGRFPLCLMFFTFLRSRGGSFNALMMRVETPGQSSTEAARFTMVIFTTVRIDLYSAVAFTISSLTFLAGTP